MRERSFVIGGITKIESVPHSVTKPIAYEMSSSLLFLADPTAATAVAPQIANPLATNKARVGDTPNLFAKYRTPVKVRMTIIKIAVKPR